MRAALGRAGPNPMIPRAVIPRTVIPRPIIPRPIIPRAVVPRAERDSAERGSAERGSAERDCAEDDHPDTAVTHGATMAPTREHTWERALPVSAEDAFQWHARPGALTRLVPPWERVRLERSSGHIRAGAEVVMRMALGPLWLRWHARHVAYDPPRRFEDVALRSPFAEWRHEHCFEPGVSVPAALVPSAAPASAAAAMGAGPEPDGGSPGAAASTLHRSTLHRSTLHRSTPHRSTPHRSTLRDRVRWRLPLAALSEPVAGAAVRRRLDAMFVFRQRRTAEDLARHARWASARPLRVAVTGSTGLVGGNLVAFLRTGGHQVTRLVRRLGEVTGDPADPTLLWDVRAPELGALSGFDAVVHLAGAPVAAGRWTPERKRAIAESREGPTRRLAQALAALPQPPRTFVSASAIGYYGDRTDPVDESAAAGEGFLADVCRRWEAAAAPASDAGIRVVHPRIGVVLDPAGGALAKMLPAWRLGLGGPAGHGAQPVSWIGLDDLLGALLHALHDPAVQGPFNAVAPQPVTNRQLAQTLAAVLRRPALLRTPAFALRAALGELADATLLGGAPVLPTALTDAGFTWNHSDLEDLLRFVLGRSAS